MPHGVRAFYGYTPEWEIDEKQSKEILLVFQYACAGKTYQDMQKKLPGWNQDKIYYTIQSAAYAGELRYNKAGVHHVIENHHPGIISRDVFEAVQLLRQLNVLRSTRRLFTETELYAMEYAWNIGVVEWGEEKMREIQEA